jgi:predicted PurR-regulated permease PerM
VAYHEEDHEEDLGLAAKRTAVITLTAVSVVAVVLALWKIREIVALLFWAYMFGAAMRPTVDRLARRRVPRGLGVALHYLVLLGLLAVFLSFVVPQAVHQVGGALGSAPTTSSELKQAARHSSGLKRQVLMDLQRRLSHLHPTTQLIHPAVNATKKALEIGVAIVLVFAAAAYWVFERDRAMGVVLRLVPQRKRRTVRETWRMVDLRLGAFVRGQIVMIFSVAIVLSVAFWLIGLPYWLLVAITAALLELIPIVGPTAAAVLAVGVGFTQDWQTALKAGLVLVGLRLLQDYVINPRVLGGVVGLTPLTVIFAVTAVGVLFGGWYVLLATPFACVVATLVDVLVMGVDPEDMEVPAVLFTPSDAGS